MPTTQTSSALSLSVQQLNRMIEQRQILEAFDRYYAPDVVMVEAGGEPMTGYDANRSRETAFVGGLTKWNARLHSSAVDEITGTALNQWTIEFDHEQYGAATLVQVAVQQWRDGRIVHESFYKL